MRSERTRFRATQLTSSGLYQSSPKIAKKSVFFTAISGKTKFDSHFLLHYFLLKCLSERSPIPFFAVHPRASAVHVILRCQACSDFDHPLAIFLIRAKQTRFVRRRTKSVFATRDGKCFLVSPSRAERLPSSADSEELTARQVAAVRESESVARRSAPESPLSASPSRCLFSSPSESRPPGGTNGQPLQQRPPAMHGSAAASVARDPCPFVLVQPTAMARPPLPSISLPLPNTQMFPARLPVQSTGLDNRYHELDLTGHLTNEHMIRASQVDFKTRTSLMDHSPISEPQFSDLASGPQNPDHTSRPQRIRAWTSFSGRRDWDFVSGPVDMDLI